MANFREIETLENLNFKIGKELQKMKLNYSLLLEKPLSFDKNS